jgi:hypothetical protein
VPYAPRAVEQRFSDPGPKRILALDGGGLRGILTLGILARVESILRKRHGDEDGLRLCTTSISFPEHRPMGLPRFGRQAV